MCLRAVTVDEVGVNLKCLVECLVCVAHGKCETNVVFTKVKQRKRILRSYKKTRDI